MIKFDILWHTKHLNTQQLEEFNKESEHLQEMANNWKSPKYTKAGWFSDADEWLNYQLWILLEDIEKQH